MDPDSPSGDEGRTFWSRLRTLLFGEDEATLRDEIEEAIENRESEVPRVGDLGSVERQMLKNILHFGDKSAADVAVPRADIIAVPAEMGFDALVAAFAEAGHSRLPVYEGSLDKVIGMLHVKDVFAHRESGSEPPADIRSLLRTPLFVPETMGMLDLLARMRSQRVHLAIVVDEFGGTEGLLTIEDVVEEIVGEIEDEHDEQLPGLLTPIDDGLWEADARAELEQVAEAVDPRFAPADAEVDTLGGLAFMLAGHIPQPGETLDHPSGWRLEVIEGDARRVSKLRLHPPRETEAA